jgi:hypothetical protein
VKGTLEPVAVSMPKKTIAAIASRPDARSPVLRSSPGVGVVC